MAVDISKRIKQLKSILPQALPADRRWAAKAIGRMQRSRPVHSETLDKTHKQLDYVHKRLAGSVRKRQQRIAQVPAYADNLHLPIRRHRAAIVKAIQTRQVVIVSGATGSGKSTQIPKYCLTAGRGIDGLIGCTQPRRIAATSIAQRVAQELDQDIGQAIGYKIRFQEKTHPDAYIQLMTDGILLAEAQSDPYLRRYDTLIIDEAHERSLNIDFILGLLKSLLAKRSDLKLIITSATIDTAKFSSAFEQAPVIEVSGRLYPVEVRYQPPSSEENETDKTYVEMAVAETARLVQSGQAGDILVFMPTEQDIRETCKQLTGQQLTGIDLMPLFARLPGAEQAKVFKTGNRRKIVVATNVAETSLTIPGIRFVVDTGLARISRYNPRSRTTALPVSPISRSSADQRKGRCGRVREGVCIRLYAEEDYQRRALYTTPEILRSNLAEVILRMMALNLGSIESFPFIDPPSAKGIEDGLQLLYELGATERRKKSPRSKTQTNPYRLTDRGRLMARLPLDPRLSRMLIEACSQDCLAAIIIIAAALSIPDPRRRPAEQEKEADQAQRPFNNPSSDFLTLLNIWLAYHQTRAKGQFCRRHFLAYRRMREWVDLCRQIRLILRDNRLAPTPKMLLKEAPATDLAIGDPIYDAIHRCIAAGFLSNIAYRLDTYRFQAAKGKSVLIFPGSVLFNQAGDWIVSAEMVETSRLYARTNARIDPSWLERLGGRLCRYSYGEPRWSKRTGNVMAYERVSLFGLPIVTRRRVTYGRQNPSEATAVFIRQAMLSFTLAPQFSFLRHNLKIIKDIQDLENKLRRRDILVDEAVMAEFYRQRLETCYSTRQLQRRIKTHKGDTFLRMRRQDLMYYDPTAGELSQFPDRINCGHNRFDCRYRFAPGQTDDGVTITIPEKHAPDVDIAQTDWLVPGLLRAKLIALLKGLPKKYRRPLVPINETATFIQTHMPHRQERLPSALSRFIHRQWGIEIPVDAWPHESLPEHLNLRFEITDTKGRPFRSGRDPRILSSPSSSAVQDPPEVAAARAEWELEGLHEWPLDDIETQVEIPVEGQKAWILYPGLKPQNDGTKRVDLHLFSSRSRRDASHPAGVAVLLQNALAKECQYLRKQVTMQKEGQHLRHFKAWDTVATDLYVRIVDDLLRQDIRTRMAFIDYSATIRPQLHRRGQAWRQACLALLAVYNSAQANLAQLAAANRFNPTAIGYLQARCADIDKLIPNNFAALYALEQFTALQRYIKAIVIRAQRGVLDFSKDEQKWLRVAIFDKALQEQIATLSPDSSQTKREAIEEYFWLLEEFKVSIFAPELKTGTKVSAKRLRGCLDTLTRLV